MERMYILILVNTYCVDLKALMEGMEYRSRGRLGTG